MKRHFVIMVDNDSTSEQRDALTAIFKNGAEYGWCGYWHHVPNGWLITDTRGTLTAAVLRDRIKALMPGITHLVLQVNDVDWAAFQKPSGNEWMRTNWQS